MQKIYFEKWIDLNHDLQQLDSLSVDESINYKIENVGVRAIGSLLVKGEYNGSEKFEKSIDLDVLATFDKIVDQRDFNIKVEDFDYTVEQGNIQIKIEVGIHGVIEGDDRYVHDEAIQEQDSLREIEYLMREEESLETSNTDNDMSMSVNAELETIKEDVTSFASDENVNVNEIAETKKPLNEKTYVTKSRPIFQDVDESVGTYYLYIVKENDTYNDVALRYNLDEMIIRDYNQNKELVSGCVLIIPYVA